MKSVTLAEGNDGFFPDAVTSRGTKHAEELAMLARQGVATALLFCVQHSGIQNVRLAGHIDPKYAQAVRQAAADGVRVLPRSCQISQEKNKIK